MPDQISTDVTGEWVRLPDDSIVYRLTDTATGDVVDIPTDSGDELVAVVTLGPPHPDWRIDKIFTQGKPVHVACEDDDGALVNVELDPEFDLTEMLRI